MGNSLILFTGARVLFPLLILFSLFLLIRGHNAPGGGFSGGLVAASAFVLYGLAADIPSTRRTLRIDPRRLIGVGLLTSLGAGVVQLFLGEPFLAGKWGYLTLPPSIKIPLGTPLLFDIGVYFVVIGVTLTILLPLEEAAETEFDEMERISAEKLPPHSMGGAP